MSDDVRIVIVGGGQVAARAAGTMRDAGFTGAISIIGEEPVLPYERPALSKESLENDPGDSLRIYSRSEFAAKSISVRCGARVISIDTEQKTVTLSDGSAMAYDKLLLATGGVARKLEVDGLDEDRVFYLRTLAHGHALRDALASKPAVAIVGGGFIGLEVAATARRLGCRVSVVEASPQLLPRINCDLASELIRNHHASNGTGLFLGSAVERAQGGTLILPDGHTVPADIVVAGIGIEPEIELAVQANLEIDNGILTDQHGQTSIPDIYAAGDVANPLHPRLGRNARLESWDSANQQARSVALAMIAQSEPINAMPWVWSDQGDLNIQIAGSPAQVDRIIARDVNRVEPAGTILQFSNGRLAGGITINRARDMPVIRRMLLADASPVDADLLADDTIPLRKCLKRA